MKALNTGPTGPQYSKLPHLLFKYQFDKII